MRRFSIPTPDFVLALREADGEQREHMLNDFVFSDTLVWVQIDFALFPAMKATEPRLRLIKREA